MRIIYMKEVLLVHTVLVRKQRKFKQLDPDHTNKSRRAAKKSQFVLFRAPPPP